MKIESRTSILNMGKKYKNLFDNIADREVLWTSYHKTSLGKKSTQEYRIFKTNEAANIEILLASLKDGTYKPSPLIEFTIYEPKERKIQALQFHDRVVQHALFSQLMPIFDKVFLPNSFACRESKGVHRCAKKTQGILRKAETTYFIKMDFKSYFASIDLEVLWVEILRKISCKRTLWLIELFHPRTGRGICIGYLTSQVLANVYAHKLDRFLTHTIGTSNWVRYMDDTVIFGSKRELEIMFQYIKTFVEEEMLLEFSKWSIEPLSKGVNFVGYRTWKTHKLLRKSSVRNAKRTIKNCIKHKDEETLRKFIASWSGHVILSDSYNLRRSLKLCK